MALYEYVCGSCSTATERRMPMAEAKAYIKCPSCGKRAPKAIGSFAVVGRASAGMGDGPAPWDDEGGMDMGMGGGHGHSHGPGMGDDFGDLDGLDF